MSSDLEKAVRSVVDAEEKRAKVDLSLLDLSEQRALKEAFPEEETHTVLMSGAARYLKKYLPSEIQPKPELGE